MKDFKKLKIIVFKALKVYYEPRPPPKMSLSSSLVHPRLGIEPNPKSSCFTQYDCLGENEIFICKCLSVGDNFWGHVLISLSTLGPPNGADLCKPCASCLSLCELI